MDKGIFAEVKRIEEEADRLVREAHTDGDELLSEARQQADRTREQSRTRLEAESARLRTEHEGNLLEEKAVIEREFDARKAGLHETAEDRSDELAEWVVSRFLEES